MAAEAGPDWADLTAELDLWAAAGRSACLWWRDDDAGEAAPALRRLLEVGAHLRLDLSLAAVPAAASPQLARALDCAPHVAVLQHGWAHHNHALPGRPAVEVGGERRVGAVLSDLAAGFSRLHDLAGPRFLPVLVPPWNRIDRSVVPHLVAAGYRGLSTFGIRPAAEPVPGLLAVNAHVDILRWRGGARFAGPAKILRQLIGQLRDRRLGAADSSEPVGLLTHHRDHDEDAWAFLHELLRTTGAHPGARWLAAAQVFGPAGSSAAEGIA